MANLRDITDSLKKFTEGLGEGTARKDIGQSLTNIRDFTDNLNTLLTGGEDAEGLHKKLVSLVDKEPELTAEMDARLDDLMDRYGDSWGA